VIRLLVATSREPELLALCLEGLRWTDLSGAEVLVVVNDSEGDNATPATLDFVRSSGVPHFVYQGRRAPNSNGLGAALWLACQIHPADRFVKIDADMFPLRRDWLRQLVAETEAAGQEIGTGLANVNGTSAPRFLAGLGEPLWPELRERLRYADVELQARLWRLTLERWRDVLAWGGGPTEIRRRGDEYLVNTNVVTWSRAWIERRSLEDWLLRGEDELAFNIAHAADAQTLAVVPAVLLLHWGYSGCKHLIEPLFPDVSARLRALWSAPDADRLYPSSR
jgi:hypothetical protein